MLGQAPELDAALDQVAHREAARNLMDLLARTDEENRNVTFRSKTHTRLYCAAAPPQASEVIFQTPAFLTKANVSMPFSWSVLRLPAKVTTPGIAS